MEARAQAPISLGAWALLLGLLIAAGTFVLPRQNFLALAPSDAESLQNLLSGVASSFFFIFVVDTVLAARSLVRKRRFKRFFGDDAATGGMRLVYPDFVLSDEVSKRISDVKPMFIYAKKGSQFSTRRHVDLPFAVAANDLQGAVIMSSALSELAEGNSQLVSDGTAVASSHWSFISFGLSSNDVTFLYLNTDPKPLFSLKETDAQIEYFSVNVGGEERRFQSNDHEQFGIILRYRPSPTLHPNRVWFICAGLGAVGTPAAAWHLAENWKRYDSKFGRRDFIVVIKTSAQLAAYRSVTEVAAVPRKR